MAGEDINRGDFVHSEKIVTSEKDTYSLDEKYANEGEEYKGSLTDAKDKKQDAEYQHDDMFHDNEDDLDIDIINEVSVIDDDPSVRCITFRSIFVGGALSALSSSIAQLMMFKPNNVPISSEALLIFAYVVCTAWAKFLPKGGWLNPGPFTIKEHTCIYILISAANVAAYGTYILSTQELYYDSAPSAAGGIFLLLGTQLVGYGIAGQLRPYLVYPSNMIWPTSLPVVSLLKTFNTNASEAKYRTRFFFIAFGASFVYHFLPQYIFPMLGGISIVCLAKDNSVWVQRMFGGLTPNEGLGILGLSFDWSLIGSNMAPLVVPFWVQMNFLLGIVLCWILVPLLYYYDVWNAKSFPFLDNRIFLRFDNGTSIAYPQKKMMNLDNSVNHEALAELGPPQFATSLAVSYVYLNMGVAASMTHVALTYGKQIWSSFRTLKKRIATGDVDIHMKIMQAYPEVPDWWYYAIFVSGIGLNIGIAYANKSQLPWWGVILAIILSTFLSLPLNMITAITGYGFGLNVLTEMVCGFILPGYPIANIYFKTLGYNTMHQAGAMAKDLKISHYLKVPPKMTFLHQMIGTVIGCIFNYIVNNTVVKSKREILLDPIGNQFWQGNSPRTINSAAITWGAIGPMAMFGPSTQYTMILWAFVIGFFLPVPGWFLHKKFPKFGFNYISTPIILNGLCLVPGNNTSWITVSIIVVFVSQIYLKRRHSVWYAKHNFLLSAALDAGASLMVFFLSIALYGGISGISYNFPNWWGNNQEIKYSDGCCKNC